MTFFSGPHKRHALSPVRGGMFLAGILIAISGCMAGRPVILDLHYSPAAGPAPLFQASPALSVVLIPLSYSGGETLGKWTGFGGKTRVIKTLPPPAEAVTEALAEYLAGVGFEVTIAPADTRPDRFAAAPPDYVAYGEIVTFKTEAESHFGFTEIKTELAYSVTFRNVKDLSRITVDIETTSKPRTVVTFAPGIFSNTVSRVLAESLELILKNIVLKDRTLIRADD